MHHNLTKMVWRVPLLHWSFPYPEVKLQQLHLFQEAKLPTSVQLNTPRLCYSSTEVDLSWEVIYSMDQLWPVGSQDCFIGMITGKSSIRHWRRLGGINQNSCSSSPTFKWVPRITSKQGMQVVMCCCVTALVFLVPCRGQLTEGQLSLQERPSEQGLLPHDAWSSYAFLLQVESLHNKVMRIGKIHFYNDSRQTLQIKTPLF